MAQSEGSSPPGSATNFKVWSVSWWKTVGVLAASLILGVGLIFLLGLFARPLALFFLALCIAAALSPLVKRLSTRLPRTTSIILIYAALLIFIIVLLLLIIPPLIAQIDEFDERLPNILERAQEFLDQYGISNAQVETLTSQLGSVGRSLLTLPMRIFSALFDAVLVLIVSLYLLMDAPNIRRFLLSLFGEKTRERIDTVGSEMLTTASGYVRGFAINILLVSTVTTIGLTLIGMPFALALGVIAGLFEALPVVGSLIAAVPILGIALLQSPTTALLTFIFIITLQVVQGNLITPTVMRGQTNVPQYLIPLAILAGGSVGGVVGALISVPVVAMLRVLILRVIAPFIRAHTGAAAYA
jgi:predicted PurR-regulated permease PerM